MKQNLQLFFTTIFTTMGVVDVPVEIETSADPAHGDYSTSVAMRLAKQLKNPPAGGPMEIALSVVEEFKRQKAKIKGKVGHQNTTQTNQTLSTRLPLSDILQAIDHMEAVAPGFINVFLTEAKISSEVARVLKEENAYGTSQINSGKKFMVEFAHPNTHKAFHIGHLRNITTGECVVRLLEASGASVVRANYQGDVGMHIAKALYSLLYNSKFKIQNSKLRTIQEKVEFLGRAYAAGSQVFEADVKEKEVIKDINYLVYASAQRLSKEKGIEPGSTDYMKFVQGRAEEVDEVYALWKETRQWSLDYFETIYKRVYSHYDRYYFESECLAGVDRANEAVKKGVLTESEGAIIFDGKQYGIDTRVFVNSLGLPTYEAKELALSEKEFHEFGRLDKIIHVVGPEQASFFQVTFKAEELLGIQKDQQLHYVYGWVKLKHGKMSSRTGQVVLGEWLLDSAIQKIYNILEQNKSQYSQKVKDDIAQKAAVAAVKYSFLKVSPKNEIAFDLDESVSFEGDSGPYLLYSYARCQSVLRKAPKQSSNIQGLVLNSTRLEGGLNPEERAVATLLMQFSDVVAEAVKNLSPNTICTYLFILAQAYNLFYTKHSILGNSSSSEKGKKAKTINHEPSAVNPFRIFLTAATAQVLKNGLNILGIETLEQM